MSVENVRSLFDYCEAISSLHNLLYNDTIKNFPDGREEIRNFEEKLLEELKEFCNEEIFGNTLKCVSVNRINDIEFTLRLIFDYARAAIKIYLDEDDDCYKYDIINYEIYALEEEELDED